MTLPSGTRHKLIVRTLAGLLFLASTSYLLIRFQWRGAFIALLKVDFLKLVLLISIGHFTYILIRAWRWRSAVRHLVPHVLFRDYYWITAVVVSLSILTPGHIGEALKIELMRRRGHLGRLPGAGAFVLERIMDLVMISSMGVAGLMFGSFAVRYPGLKTAVPLMVGFGLLALCALLCIDPGGRSSSWLSQLRRGVSSKTILLTAFLTALSWLIVAVNWQIALNAVQITLSPLEIVLLLSLVTVGSLLSLMPGGIGVSELVTTVILTNMGVVAVTAQAGVLALHVYGLIVILFGLIHLGASLIYQAYSARNQETGDRSRSQVTLMADARTRE